MPNNICIGGALQRFHITIIDPDDIFVEGEIDTSSVPPGRPVKLLITIYPQISIVSDAGYSIPYGTSNDLLNDKDLPVPRKYAAYVTFIMPRDNAQISSVKDS